jgi:hypothetical protein
LIYDGVRHTALSARKSASHPSLMNWQRWQAEESASTSTAMFQISGETIWTKPLSSKQSTTLSTVHRFFLLPKTSRPRAFIFDVEMATKQRVFDWPWEHLHATRNGGFQMKSFNKAERQVRAKSQQHPLLSLKSRPSSIARRSVEITWPRDTSSGR